MNYLAEILAFNNWIKYNFAINKSDICLWHFFMSMANRFAWQEFNVPILTIVSESKLSKNEFYKSRNKLKQFGLIDFKERGGNKATIYKMNSVVSLYGTQTQTQIGTQIGTQTVTQNGSQSGNIHKTKNQKPETKNKKEINKEKYGEFSNVLLTVPEYEKLKSDLGDDQLNQAIKYLDEYIEEKGYKSKSHNLAIRRWVLDAVKERSLRGTAPASSKIEQPLKTKPSYDISEIEAFDEFG